MLPYGGDRLRETGGKIILQSSISKGWTPRRAKTHVHAEYPGTAVLWDEQYFEVTGATPLHNGGVRYVLEPWRDEHVIRVFDLYDEVTEGRRIAEHRAALAQRKKSTGVSLAGVILGHFPKHVQEHLENEFGVSAARMTLVSCLPSLVVLGACVWLYTDARMREQPSPVPIWVWILAMVLFFESAIRFNVSMSQSRGMGSFEGFLAYIFFWLLPPIHRKWPSPFITSRGHKLFTLPPPDDVALRDKLETRGALLTLLSSAEQVRLAQRFGFDYRRHAFGLAWIILVFSSFGAVSSLVKVADSGSVSALTSLIVAGALAIEQVARLVALQRGPAGSFLGVIVRPFMRDLLERG